MGIALDWLSALVLLWHSVLRWQLALIDKELPVDQYRGVYEKANVDHVEDTKALGINLICMTIRSKIWRTSTHNNDQNWQICKSVEYHDGRLIS